MNEYSVIVVAAETDKPGKYEYKAYHLKGEEARETLSSWHGRECDMNRWSRKIHFLVRKDMSWGMLGDELNAPLAWRTTEELWASHDISYDEVANNMLDIARSSAFPNEYLAWVKQLNEAECESSRNAWGQN